MVESGDASVAESAMFGPHRSSDQTGIAKDSRVESLSFSQLDDDAHLLLACMANHPRIAAPSFYKRVAGRVEINMSLIIALINIMI